MERLRTEIRSAAGRRLEGIALRFDDVARIGQLSERFEKGAVVLRQPSIINLEHDPLAPLAIAEWELDDNALRFSGELGAGELQDQALADVKNGKLVGASIEFRALEQRFDGPMRVLEKALIGNVALTDSPAYSRTEIELRSKLLAPPRRRRRFFF